MAYADPQDVAVRLGRSLTDDELAQAYYYLEDIEAMIRLRIGTLDSKATADEYYLAVVVAVEAKAVKRVFMNPNGIRQHSEAVDDGSSSDTYDTAISAGDLYVSDDEWVQLGGGKRGSGSFSMARGYAP